jgi:hypothetical protein
MQSPAGAKRRAARMLRNVDRGKWGQHLIPYTLGLYVTCVSPNSSLVVAAMCRLGSAFRRERVPDDDGALLSGSYFPPSSSAAAGTSAENGRCHISTTGVETRRTPLAPPRAHPPPQTWTQPWTLPRIVFCDQIQNKLVKQVGGAQGDAHESPFSWQHGWCATHTLQLSVRAGLAIKPVRALLDKVRLVAKLRRPSTNFQRQLELSAAAESRAAEHSGSGRTATVHRRTLDCPTRRESTLVIVERSLRVASAVAAALSAYRSQASTSKKEVEALNVQRQSPMMDFHPGPSSPMPVNRYAICLGLTCATVTALASSDLDRASTRSCASYQSSQNLTLAAHFLVRPPARL